MRKITLMLSFLAIGAVAFAQTPACELNEGGKVQQSKVLQHAKAFGDVIWSEDFNGDKWMGTVKEDGQGYLLDVNQDLPLGWTITDGNELNYFWHWSNVGPRGKYVSTPWDAPRADVVAALANIGASTDNGFMMLESAYFNTNPVTGAMSSNPLDMDAVIQYGPIDFSGETGAIFNIKTIYRFCCSPDATLALELSSDYNPGTGTGTWDVIPLNVLTNGNEYTNAKERDFLANVSIYVSNKPAVYFRLHQTLSSHYLWIVDDIKFTEPPVNDLVVEDVWFDYMYDATDPDYGQSSSLSHNFWGGYTQIPHSVVSNFIQFRAGVINNGVADAVNAKVNVSIKKDGAQVYTVASTPKTVAKFLRDTLIAAADFTPTNKGYYQVSMTVNMDGDDEIPSNNGLDTYEFNVVHDVYSRVTMGGEANFGSAGPSDWQGGGLDGDICAQPFDFPASVTEVTLKAVKVFIPLPYDVAEEDAIKAGEFAMYARIYKIDEAGDIVESGIASELYTLQISDTNSWVTLNLLDEGNLVVAGGQTYYAGIETYTGATTANTLSFQIGSDPFGPKQPNTGGLVYLSDTWYRTGDNYAIDLVLDVPTVLPIDFESGNVKFNSWSSVTTVIDNPYSSGINTSAKVAQHVKEAGNAWAGVIIELGETLDFSTTKTFSMKVYSPAAKTPVLFKLEVAGGAVKEVMEKTTKANEWETITWNFDGTESGVFQKLVLFFNAGVDGAGTYLFDDIYLNESVKVTFNVDMTQPIADPAYFVAGTNPVYVTGSFANGLGETWGWDEPGKGESLLMTDTDGDNIYTASVTMLKDAGEYMYKYFINADWLTGDQIGGDRTLNVGAADVTTADVWEHAVSVTEKMNLNAVTLTPNPFKSELVISNAEGAKQVVISNMLGQTIMTVNEITNNQVLSTEGLNKGVYFVTIIDQNNNRRTERVVKQ